VLDIRELPGAADQDGRIAHAGREDFQNLLGRSEKLKIAMTGTSDARYVETQNSLLLRR